MPDLPLAVEVAIDNAVERIGDRFHGHEAMLRQHLAQPVSVAYWSGRHEAIRDYRTTTEVAAELGITRRHLAKIANDMGIGTRIADVVLFLPEDVEAIRNRPDGRRRG